MGFTRETIRETVCVFSIETFYTKNTECSFLRETVNAPRYSSSAPRRRPSPPPPPLKWTNDSTKDSFILLNEIERTESVKWSELPITTFVSFFFCCGVFFSAFFSCLCHRYSATNRRGGVLQRIQSDPLGSCACKFLWTRLHLHAIKDSIRVKNEPGIIESRLRVHGASITYQLKSIKSVKVEGLWP